MTIAIWLCGISSRKQTKINLRVQLLWSQFVIEMGCCCCFCGNQKNEHTKIVAIKCMCHSMWVVNRSIFFVFGPGCYKKWHMDTPNSFKQFTFHLGYVSVEFSSCNFPFVGQTAEKPQSNNNPNCFMEFPCTHSQLASLSERVRTHSCTRLGMFWRFGCAAIVATVQTM